MMLGLIADLIGRNRQLLEQTLERVRVLEDAVAENNSEPHNIVALKNDSASAKSRAV
jgi:site-specific recombinase